MAGQSRNSKQYPSIHEPSTIQSQAGNFSGLAVRLGKLRLMTPVVCASGTFGFGQELKGLVRFRSVGAVITKTITLSPRAGNPPPRIFETECGVLNSVGLENPGLGAFIKEKLPQQKNIGTKFIVSVGGFSQEEYQEAVTKLDQLKTVEAFEINLSCPNLRLKKMISQDSKATYQLVKSLRGITQKTLIVKITPEVTDISEIAQAVERAGADAVSLVNTFLGMAININTKKCVLGNGYGGYSGKAVKPMSLYRVWKTAQSVKIPVVGGGGIESADDAIEFILAGATAVSLGTINLVCPNQAQEIVRGIIAYMRKHTVKNILDLRGTI